MEFLHWKIFSLIKDFVESDLRLKFNKKTQVFNVKRGIDFLGYRQFPGRLILRKRVMQKNFRKFKKQNKIGNKEKIIKSLASFEGICKHCSSRNILNKVYNIIGEHQNGNRHLSYSQ